MKDNYRFRQPALIKTGPDTEKIKTGPDTENRNKSMNTKGQLMMFQRNIIHQANEPLVIIYHFNQSWILDFVYCFVAQYAILKKYWHSSQL